MFEALFPFLLVLLIVGLIWGLLKFFLKKTAKIFTWGCLVLIVIGAILFFLGGGIPSL